MVIVSEVRRAGRDARMVCRGSIADAFPAPGDGWSTRYTASMTNRQRAAYVLIGLGTITLLARLSDGAGWLWIGLVAAAMLFAYSRQRTYGLLVLGGFLAGTAVGILLQEVFRNEAFFLISLGAGVAAIDLVERRASRWPRTLGAVLAAIGVLIGLANAGAFASVWFALLLIAVGVAIIARGSGPGASSFPPPRVDAREPRAPHARAMDAGSGSPDGPPTRPASAAAPDTATAEAAEPVTAETVAAEPVTAETVAAETVAAEPVTAAPEANEAAPPPRQAPPSAPEGAAEATDAVTARRARLEAWRARTSEAEARAPQAVLSDEVLRELAERAPHDLDALAEVRGIGPVKLERYGAELVEVVHADHG
jgi:hypothetical protein